MFVSVQRFHCERDLGCETQSAQARIRLKKCKTQWFNCDSFAGPGLKLFSVAFPT